jgi:hypothetical protein
MGHSGSIPRRNTNFLLDFLISRIHPSKALQWNTKFHDGNKILRVKSTKKVFALNSGPKQIVTDAEWCDEIGQHQLLNSSAYTSSLMTECYSHLL